MPQGAKTGVEVATAPEHAAQHEFWQMDFAATSDAPRPGSDEPTRPPLRYAPPRRPPSVPRCHWYIRTMLPLAFGLTLPTGEEGLPPSLRLEKIPYPLGVTPS